MDGSTRARDSHAEIFHKTYRLSIHQAHPNEIIVLDQGFIALVVLNAGEAAMLDVSTPIDTLLAYTQCTGTSKAVVELAPMCSKTHSVCTAKLVGSRNNKTGCSSSPHANQSMLEFTTCEPT